MTELWWRSALVYSIMAAMTVFAVFGLWRAYDLKRAGLFFGSAALLAISGIAFGVQRQVFGPGAERVHVMAFFLGFVAFGGLVGATDRRHGSAVAAWALALWIASAIFGAVRMPHRDVDPDAPENLGVPSRYSYVAPEHHGLLRSCLLLTPS